MNGTFQFPRCNRLGTTLLLAFHLAGCATAPSEPGRSSAVRFEQSKSNHPWLDTVIGAPNVSSQQFDELSWWQQISACISAIFVRGAYDTAASNSERQLR
jgi:hypothetical protein